jgi:hypothetical protein
MSRFKGFCIIYNVLHSATAGAQDGNSQGTQGKKTFAAHHKYLHNNSLPVSLWFLSQGSNVPNSVTCPSCRSFTAIRYVDFYVKGAKPEWKMCVIITASNLNDLQTKAVHTLTGMNASRHMD